MDGTSFTFVDVIVVAVLLISAIMAVSRGFIRETLSIVAWVAAAYAALYLGPSLTRALHPIVTGWLAIIAAYTIIFLVVVIPLSFVSYRFSQTVHHSPIGPVDQALGAVFGAVRGLAIIALLYLGFSMVVRVPDQPRWMHDARFLPLIQSSSETLLSIIPDQTIDRVADRVRASVPPQAARVRHRRLADDAETGAETGRATKRPKKAYGKSGDDAISKLIEANGGGQP